MIAVTAKKLVNFKFRIQCGYAVLNGWVVSCDRGMFSTDGVFPHIFRSKAVAEMVAADGLLDGAEFVK